MSNKLKPIVLIMNILFHKIKVSMNKTSSISLLKINDVNIYQSYSNTNTHLSINEKN